MSLPELVLHVRAMPLLLFVFARRSLYATYSLPYSCSSVKIRANQHFARKTTFQTTAYVHTYGTTLARICQNPHQARARPYPTSRPPDNAFYTPLITHITTNQYISRTHATRNSPIPPSFQRPSFFSLPSQPKHTHFTTQTPPAHMSPMPYQSHPPPNVTSIVLLLTAITILQLRLQVPKTNSSTCTRTLLPGHSMSPPSIKRTIAAPQYTPRTKQYVLAHHTRTHSTKHPSTHATRKSPIPPSPQRH